MDIPRPLSLSVRTENWPIAGAFSISRGAKTEAAVVVTELSDGRHKGRGECVPYARYDETVSGVLAALASMREPLARGLDRAGLQRAMPAGAARNALDCAFWDLEAKRAGRPAYELAGLPPPQAADHRLHDLARNAGRDGRSGAGCGACDRCSRSSSAVRAIPIASAPCAGPRRIRN